MFSIDDEDRSYFMSTTYAGLVFNWTRFNRHTGVVQFYSLNKHINMTHQHDDTQSIDLRQLTL